MSAVGWTGPMERMHFRAPGPYHGEGGAAFDDGTLVARTQDPAESSWLDA